MIASLSQSSWPDFEEYRPLVSACAKRFLRSQSACALSLDDLMQEAWLAMHDASRHLWRIPVDKHTAYMARVIRYSLLKRHREMQPLDTVGICDREEPAKSTKATEGILALLSPKDRNLLVAYFSRENEASQDIDSLASEMGISVRTLHRRVNRCKKQLSLYLGLDKHPTKSTRQLAAQLGVSSWTLRKRLRQSRWLRNLDR